MDMAETVSQAGWRARLELEFEQRGERCVLAAKRHDGPLVVQKSLYPEGDSVCHAIIVHPPAGIAGGDELSLAARAGRDAHVVLATPGAGKWYRSSGAWARQAIRFDVAAGGGLEWLPQETILFDGCLSEIHTDIHLEPGARYIGWDIVCFGRGNPVKSMQHGHCRIRTRVTSQGKSLFVECGDMQAASAQFTSPAALGGNSVSGTMLAVSPVCDKALLCACRELQPERGNVGITLLPGLLVARYLGESSESAKRYFIALRRLLRPAIMNCEANDLRIWST
jgi:urease accessory protein